MKNSISAVLTQQNLTNIIAALETIEKEMPFLLGLDETSRKALLKINSGNKTFTEDTIKVAEGVKNLLPPFTDLAELRKDLELFEMLDKVRLRVEDILSRIEDTQVLAGAEAFSQSLLIYNALGNAAKAKQPGAQGAYDQLKPRFERQGPRKKPAPADKKPAVSPEA